MTQYFKRMTAVLVLVLNTTMALAANPATGTSGIVLGQIGPFTVFPGSDAVEVNQGVKAYLAQANKIGVHGIKISSFEADDRYSGDAFVSEFGKALERRPLAMISPIGSNALKRLLEDRLLDNNAVVVMNAIPGAESFRAPGHPNLFHIRAGDRQQIEKIVRHSRTIGIARMTVLYQDLAIGTSGMAMAQQEGERSGVEVKTVKATPDAAGLAAAVRQPLVQDAQGVLVVGSPKFMIDGVASLRKAGFSRSIFILSYAPVAQVVKAAGVDGARGVGIAQTYPNPNGRTLPLIREFQSAMKASYPSVSEFTAFQLEGYVSARTVVEALRFSKEKEVSAAALARALRSMGRLELGGFHVDFSKGNLGSSFVDIAVIGHKGNLIY